VTRSAAIAELVQELELEQRQLSQILHLLEEERGALADGQVERLPAIAAEKLSQLQSLELFTRRRSELLRDLGYTSDAAGMLACAEAAGPQRKRMQALWQKLAARAEEARTANELNGKLIRIQLAAVQGRLAQLNTANGTLSTYGADGLARPALQGRALGQT